MAHHKRRRPKHLRAGCLCQGKWTKDDRYRGELPPSERRRVQPDERRRVQPDERRGAD